MASKLTDAMDVEIPSGITNARREEGFVIVCEGDRLVLAGNNDGPYHGTEYAVYEFLNRLGVRWFMPGEFGEYVPRQATIDFPETQLTERPDFVIRCGEEDARWQIRNKHNPDGMGFGVGDSSVMYLVPSFEDHPEVYAVNTPILPRTG